jgi:general secretion pathway protein B
MSYILNALRKSEQERQANQPETITEQVLMRPPRKSRKTAILVGGLLAANLLAFSCLVWYLKKTGDTPAAKPQADAQPLRRKAERKPLPAAEEINSEQEAKKEPTAAAVPDAVSPQIPVTAAPAAKAPSIEELAAVKQAAEEKAAKLSQQGKAERAPQADASPAVISLREQFRKRSQARRAMAAHMNDPERESTTREENTVAAAPPPPPEEIPLFKDLPYSFRNSAPHMAINVFVYDIKPEDRFVVLNMTKYKVGQTTKDSVEIKEIRPDGVIASYGGRVFRIERP